ncbi:hypothetical protein CROQUDRAFT_79172 [Cronartium quercuum f. sp. fusiforme G11]|uniref:Uncharacterized protein n=1 Tax=Cronartium quercuum f. sp. fusiforme G11 TaxID=708437 RepID=A0A9P6NK73_9BASI|nr:hypothetical protein CROQUDRAFT_79172 [Cronartium quercuum f. sp. fusiforme G11]
MISTAIRQASHVHKPMIRFLGKRVHDSKPTQPGPHPLAPSDVKESFATFVDHQRHPTAALHNSAPAPSQSNGSKSTPRVLFYEDVSELPWSYHTPSEAEIELINGGGIMR